VRAENRLGSTIRHVADRVLTITLDEHLAAVATDSAARQGISLSAWINDAVRRALGDEELALEVEGWEGEGGAVPPDG